VIEGATVVSQGGGGGRRDAEEGGEANRRRCWAKLGQKPEGSNTRGRLASHASMALIKTYVASNGTKCFCRRGCTKLQRMVGSWFHLYSYS
jgi:hypothetical protein